MLNYRVGVTGLLAVLIACGLAATASALTVTETILPATNPAGDAKDRNGWDVALDGDTIIVGAPGLGVDPGGNVARVYTNDGSAWSYQATLQPSGALIEDFWGAGVAIQGDTAAIGGRDYSAVTVFTRSGTTWTEGQTLLGPLDGRFGNSVALDGDWIVGGAERNSNVFISHLEEGTWSDPVALDRSAASLGASKLGYDVAIDGDWILGGAISSNAVHVWKYDAGTEAWGYHSGIDNGDDDGLFGISVDMEGERAIVGARSAASNDGKAYIYAYNSGTDTWDLEQTLEGESGSDELFGSAVSLSGDMAVVSAYKADVDGAADAGAAYVYKLSGGTWSLEQKITAETPIAGGGYGGNAVACSDSEIVVGAPHRDSWAAAGNAYVYDISAGTTPLAGDLNDDGFVGGDDLDIVRSFWGQTVPSGELISGDPSNDGFVGGDDLDIVRANWGQGSPPAPTAVPEPSVLLMILVGGPCLALAAYRRRKGA